MASDEGCQKAHAGKPAYDEAVVIGKSGGLANAFVYIQAGLEGKKFEPSTEAVVMDQHGCMFVPRIIGIRRRTNPRPQERRCRLPQRPSHAGQQSRMEPGAGAAGPHRATPLRPPGNHDPRQMQHPRLDALLHRRGGSSLLRRHRSRWHRSNGRTCRPATTPSSSGTRSSANRSSRSTLPPLPSAAVNFTYR